MLTKKTEQSSEQPSSTSNSSQAVSLSVESVTLSSSNSTPVTKPSSSSEAVSSKVKTTKSVSSKSTKYSSSNKSSIELSNNSCTGSVTSKSQLAKSSGTFANSICPVSHPVLQQIIFNNDECAKISDENNITVKQSGWVKWFKLKEAKRVKEKVVTLAEEKNKKLEAEKKDRQKILQIQRAEKARQWWIKEKDKKLLEETERYRLCKTEEEKLQQKESERLALRTCKAVAEWKNKLEQIKVSQVEERERRKEKESEIERRMIECQIAYHAWKLEAQRRPRPPRSYYAYCAGKRIEM